MNPEESRISFIIRNYASSYDKSKLKLPIPFFLEYGMDLPEKVFLHVPSKAIWSGKIVKGSRYIEDLDEMIAFHRIKPYHVVLLHYVGGGHFNLNIFNPYCVEINYKVGFSNTIQSMATVPGLDVTKFDNMKLLTTYRYNLYDDLVGMYDLVINENHLKGKSYTKVLSKDAYSKLALTDDLSSIFLRVGKCLWTVNLRWSKGELWFDAGWVNFAQACDLIPGDVIVFCNSKTSRTIFKIVLFVEKLVSKSQCPEELSGCTHDPKFLKITMNHLLETGELEVPTLFIERYGQTLKTDLHVELGGGKHTKFRFCTETHKIYGLNRFIRRYAISVNYMLIFTYFGESRFALSVYDSLCMDHFRDIAGFIRLEDFVNPPDGIPYIDLSAVNGTTIEDEEMEVDNAANIGVVEISSEEEEPFTEEMHVVEMDNEGGELEVGAEIQSFTIKLKKSHIHQRCHGAYIPRTLRSVYSGWGRRTMVTLMYLGRGWNAEVIRTGNVCRFGIGWDDFTYENHFATEKDLSFYFIGDHTFEVIYSG